MQVTALGSPHGKLIFAQLAPPLASVELHHSPDRSQGTPCMDGPSFPRRVSSLGRRQRPDGVESPDHEPLRSLGTWGAGGQRTTIMRGSGHPWSTLPIISTTPVVGTRPWKDVEMCVCACVCLDQTTPLPNTHRGRFSRKKTSRGASGRFLCRAARTSKVKSSDEILTGDGGVSLHPRHGPDTPFPFCPRKSWLSSLHQASAGMWREEDSATTREGIDQQSFDTQHTRRWGDLSRLAASRLNPHW